MLDPAALDGSDADKRTAFAETYDLMTQRIEKYISLRFSTLSKLSLLNELTQIGRAA